MSSTYRHIFFVLGAAYLEPNFLRSYPDQHASTKVSFYRDADRFIRDIREFDYYREQSLLVVTGQKAEGLQGWSGQDLLETVKHMNPDTIGIVRTSLEPQAHTSVDAFLLNDGAEGPITKKLLQFAAMDIPSDMSIEEMKEVLPLTQLEMKG